MGDIYGYTYTVTADASAAKVRVSLTPTTKRVHVRAILFSTSSAAEADGILVQRGTAVADGTAATEFSLNGDPTASTPNGAVTNTTGATGITLTGAQTIHRIDLAASDREGMKFPHGAFTLEPGNYDCLGITQPLGSSVLTITLLWEEE